jgi:hypothetical protein
MTPWAGILDARPPQFQQLRIDKLPQPVTPQKSLCGPSRKSWREMNDEELMTGTHTQEIIDEGASGRHPSYAFPQPERGEQ